MRWAAVIAMTTAVLIGCSKERTAESGARQQSAPAAAPGGTISNAFKDAVTVMCDRGASSIEGNEGTSWYLRCPACPLDTRVWGTDFYTDDSLACAAAVHAGAISKDGGTVLMTWVKGQPSYAASERNGVASRDYGTWHRSFFVQGVGADGQPTTAAPVALAEGRVRGSCTMTGDMVPGGSTVSCPPNCVSGRVFGTDIYTGDTPLCVAGVHAGVITAERGGNVKVTRTGRQESFKSTTQNAVTSREYGPWHASFQLSR
jgi:hypothetical protein